MCAAGSFYLYMQSEPAAGRRKLDAGFEPKKRRSIRGGHNAAHQIISEANTPKKLPFILFILFFLFLLLILLILLFRLFLFLLLLRFLLLFLRVGRRQQLLMKGIQ